MKLFKTTQRDERGQVLVIVGVGLIAIVAMVGLVIDGGNAWGQQRKTQNGADAMSLAGATALAQNLAGTYPAKTDGDVGCAIAAAAAANGVANPNAFYTDVTGTFLTPSVKVGPCAAGQGGLVPAAAAGVKAAGDRTFNTYLMPVIGFSQLTASANATAVTGLLASVCPADAGCGVLPVTFPVTLVYCDNTSQQVQIGSGPYSIVQTTDPTGPNYATSLNEAILPLCKTGPGAVGWLDLGASCGNLLSTITTPCNVSIPIPAWLKTSPGNPNTQPVESAINAYAGPLLGVPDDSVVTIPLNDGTCSTQPLTSDLAGCTSGAGQGSNLYYHIPKFIGFMLDRAYLNGGNSSECNSPPGLPFAQGNGGTGCLKGWFVREILTGPVVGGASGPQDPGIIGIQLLR